MRFEIADNDIGALRTFNLDLYLKDTKRWELDLSALKRIGNPLPDSVTFKARRWKEVFVTQATRLVALNSKW